MNGVLSRIGGTDREFLPAALEIQETPPAPLPMAMMGTICLFGLTALLWSFVGHLDVHAVAQGKIESAQSTKIIQPLEPGKVAAIRVENGTVVKAGEVVVELDPSEARADLRTSTDRLTSGQAEIARRRFMIETVKTAQARILPPEMPRGEGFVLRSSLPPEPETQPAATVVAAMRAQPMGPTVLGTDAAPEAKEAPEPRLFTEKQAIPFDPALPEDMRRREEAVMTAELARLADAVAAIDMQMSQKIATRHRLEMAIANDRRLIDTVFNRVGTRQQAIELKVGTKINLYDAQEALDRAQASLAADQGQLIETDATLAQLHAEKLKVLSQAIADDENKLAEAARRVDEARQLVAKAEVHLARTHLVSPIDGVVQKMAVTTIGQVVTTGQQLLVVTPNQGTLQVVALVSNLDVGFVKVGQPVVVKVDAFPFTRFGTLHGKVTKIATEAVDESEAKRTLANATAPSAGPGAVGAGAGQPQNFVFPVTVSLEETSIRVDDAVIPLTPGMTVAIDVETNRRRVIDYLFSPIAKVTSEALREP